MQWKWHLKRTSIYSAVPCHLISLLAITRHAWNSFLPSVGADGTISEQQTLPGSSVASNSTILAAGASASLKIDAGIGSKIAGL
jgi:hypothetical protein